MVAKVDTDEMLAEVRSHGIIIGFLTLILTVLAGISAGFLYKHQGKRAFQALYQAESALRNAEKEYKTILYSIGDGVITTDMNGRIRQMNPVAEQLTGWAEADAKGRPTEAVFRIISEATGETVDSPVQKVLEKGLIVGLANHTLLIAKDGTQTPIADSGAPIRDETPDTTGVVLVFRDQVKERFAEASLRQEKTFSDTTINSLPGIFYLFNEEGHFLKWNKNFEVVSGYSSEEMEKMHPLDFFSGEEKKRIEETIQEALIKGESYVEANFISKEGGSAPHYFTCYRFISDNKPYLVGMGIDISERKKTETKLLTLSAHQQALLSAIPDIIMQVDINKVYTWANQPGYDFFGKDVIGKGADFYFEGDQPVYDMVQPLFNGNENIIYLESWQRRKDGQKRLLAWWCRVLKDRQGNATGALSTARDITDHRTMEDQLRQAQKMESVGRLAGGVAHDFNNMLMVIITYTEMVIEQVDSAQPIFKDLQEILNAAKRSVNLTRQLLAFARKQTISPVVLDVNDTISSMFKLLRQLIGENIDLAWQPGLDIWPVKMDPSQIDQILANLLVNAKDAIGGVGSITIETDNVEFDDAYCARNMGFVPGKYVMIAVSDTGAGMERQTLDHLFEPFFTTKEIGKGTGLGLATVYGIVKQNNGFINVYSEPGDGTVFKIYFPRTEDGLAEIPAAKAGKNLRGNETVMIVEDEESILNLGASILKQYGYTVISAKSPDDALALAKQFDGEIHLLVTDVVMPRMHGKELMEKLRDTRPGIKSIFMSGYTANAIAHHGVLESGVQFLQKPFSVKALAQKVREVLDGE
jgi:PAS domain S-box-containing protein